MMSMRHLTYAPFNADKDGDIHHLFCDYKFKDYQHKFMGVSKEQMVQYLKKTLSEPGAQSICMREGNQLVGLISLKSLPWMSNHFGFRMYAVTHLLAKGENPLVHARLLRYVMEELPNVDFLDCRVAVDDVCSTHALEICGFRYVGAEIYLGQFLKAGDPPEPQPRFEIRPLVQPQDQDRVLAIAGETHTHNRFAYDPFINGHAAKSLYQRLVANCFKHNQFDVLVAQSAETVEGFIISKLNLAFSQEVGFQCGSLDFIGVDPEIRNRGLGKALNQWALYHLAQKGVVYAAVRTMASNYAALTLVHRTGFQMTSTSLHFHKWVARPTVSFNVLPSFESISTKTLFSKGRHLSKMM
jgi:ribosomal protein S18 acetylase RimI-like enzyme